MNKIKSACFTGHRKISESDKSLFDKVVKCVEKLIFDGITDFYAGGAVGFDTIAEKAVLYLRDVKHLPIKLHLVLPCRNEDQTKNWTQDQKFQLNVIQKKADSVEFTSNKYHPSCMKIRNARLVELADDACICYLKPNSKSGTAQTVKYATDKGLDIYNLYGTDEI